MKILDRILSCLLILGGIGHTAGSLIGYRNQPEILLWSLCASLFIFLLGSVNFVRTGRPGDSALGWITLIFNLCWLAGDIQFGRIIHHMLDPRVIGFSLITLLLSALSLRTITAKA